MAQIDPETYTIAGFRRALAELGITKWTEAAVLLDRHISSISGYARGAIPIPDAVHSYVQDLIAVQRQTKQPPSEVLHAKREAAIDPGRRMRGGLDPIPEPAIRKQLPPYHMKRSQLMLVTQALRQWQLSCVAQAQGCTGRGRQEAQRELIRIKQIASRLPRQSPLYVSIYEHEWPTCSRALLNMGGKARNFYQTWRKNRYVGKHHTGGFRTYDR